MQVRLRLQRAGKSAKKTYNYRVIAISKTAPRQGRHLEILGYYDAAKKPAVSSLDLPKIDQWLAKGAQMSETVRSLVKQARKK